VPQRIAIEQQEGQIHVTRPTDRGQDRALHGLTRTLVANMVEGVTKGFEKKLEIQGVGYRAVLKGTDIELAVGYPSRRRSSSRARTSSTSARPPRRSARSARRSRTRARASATRASTFAGRSGSAHEHSHRS
jgi:hypothetical protein